MGEFVHIVCLDAPSPPDYGGVFDLYYKIPALHQLGIKINLHYFDYKPGRNANGLEAFCENIYSYTRSSFTRSLFSNMPYIVQSRINEELIKRLNSDGHPVIIEGIHCSGIIPYIEQKRKIILRLHNDEAAYYRYLSKWEKSFFKKQYFLREAKLLERYQKDMSPNLAIVCVSELDQSKFINQYNFKETHFLPCFLPWQEVKSKEGQGSYCLYHGNMEVSENIESAKWLIENVFNDINVPLTVAGKGAGYLSVLYPNTSNRFIESPDDNQLNELIADAHIHALPAFNRTGVKIKLLHALFEGRFCFTNSDGVIGSGLAENIPGLEGIASWKQAIKDTMNLSFTTENKIQRKDILSLYNNEANAKKLSELL